MSDATLTPAVCTRPDERTVTVTDIGLGDFDEGFIEDIDWTFEYSPGMAAVCVPDYTPEWVCDALRELGDLTVVEGQNEMYRSR